MEYCKYLKLTNGENIIVTTDNDCKDFKKNSTLSIYNPVELTTIRMANGPMIIESLSLQPWIKVALNDIIEVPTEHILVITDLKKDAIEQYKTYLEEYERHQNRDLEDIEIDPNEDHQDLLDRVMSHISEMSDNEEESEPEFQYERKARYKRTIH